MTLTGGNRHDVTRLLALVDAFPLVRGVCRRPRLRPDYLYADRGYDYDIYRRALRERGIVPPIARRGVVYGSGLGRIRWVVERSFSWCTSSIGGGSVTRCGLICTWVCCSWRAL